MRPLRQRVIEDMQPADRAAATEKLYADVTAFAGFFSKSPEYLDREAVDTSTCCIY